MYFLRFLWLCASWPCVLSDSNHTNYIELRDSSFQRVLEPLDHVLVMFYEANCTACSKFHIHMCRAAEQIVRTEVPAMLARMNCTCAGRRTCQLYRIDAPPVLLFYQKGKFVKTYGGSRSHLSVVKFIRAQVLPPSEELKSVDEFKTFLKKQNDAFVMGFFHEESKLMGIFKKLANEMRLDMNFAHTTCERLLIKEGVSNGVVVYRPPLLQNSYEEERLLFEGRDVVGEVKTFLLKSYHGLVGHRTPVNTREFSNPKVVVYYPSSCEDEHVEMTRWHDFLLPAADKYENVIHFSISAMSDFEEELKQHGLDPRSETPLVVARDLENTKHIFTEDFSSEKLGKFVETLVQTKLTMYGLSQLGGAIESLFEALRSERRAAQPSTERIKVEL